MLIVGNDPRRGNATIGDHAVRAAVGNKITDCGVRIAAAIADKELRAAESKKSIGAVVVEWALLNAVVPDTNVQGRIVVAHDVRERNDASGTIIVGAFAGSQLRRAADGRQGAKAGGGVGSRGVRRIELEHTSVESYSSSACADCLTGAGRN